MTKTRVADAAVELTWDDRHKHWVVTIWADGFRHTTYVRTTAAMDRAGCVCLLAAVRREMESWLEFGE